MWFLFSLLDDVSQQENATGIKNEFVSLIVISICKMMDQHQSVCNVFTSPEIISCMASVIFSSRTSIKSQSVYESAVVEQSVAVLTESDQAADDFNVFKAAFQNLAGAASAIAADIMDLSVAHHQPPVAEPESALQANADLNDINGEETRDWDLIGSEEVCSRVLKSNVQAHIRTLQSFETRSLRGYSDGFKSKRRVRLERLNRLFPFKSAECM
jgi:hypothetical protein